MKSWERTLSKLQWAANNPAKVRESNRRWRAGKERRLAQQAKLRMRKMRARRVCGLSSSVTL